MARCKVLREYSEFVARIRKYIGKEASVREAVEQAVTECIREGILEEFLLSQRSEVVAMSIFEYDHEVEMKKLADEMREQLREEVREEVQEELQDKFREEGKAQFLLLVLNLRGTVPKWLKERILCERDSELLESWMKTAADTIGTDPISGARTRKAACTTTAAATSAAGIERGRIQRMWSRIDFGR